MTTLWFAVPLYAVAIGAALCARSTRHTRNYYPMQRVMWFALAMVYGGSATAATFGAPTNPLVRAVFTGLMLAAVLYSLWFIRRRNRTPRYLPLALGGQVEMVAQPELWAAYERAISLTYHGDAPAAWVAQMEAAITHWREEQRRPQTLGQRMKQQALARRRGGIE